MFNTSRRKSTLILLGPTILAGIGAVVLSAGVLFAAVSQTDSVVRAQQSALLSTTLAKQLPRIVHDQGGVAIWDDAIENVKVRLDPDWLDANLGVWMHDFFGLDRAFVLTDQNEPAYAMVDGKRATPASFRQVAAAVDPLVAEIRREIPYPVAASDDPPHAAALVQIGGRPAIASVMPILSDTGDVPQESGSEYLHVSIEFLDGTFLSELTKDYSIQSPPFSWTRETDGKEAAVPILQAGGSAFGYAVWMPYQPGWSLLKRTAPTLAASILVLAAIIALLSRRLLRASARARHLAFHDPLSNLANRNLFNETLDRALATRAGDRVGVLCIDLDRFKHVNDTLGHPAGDELIRQLAIRLTSFVSDSDHVARLGGDEFAIILVEHEDALVLETCRRIIDAVATPFELSGSKAFVGASIGTAIAPHHGTSRSELMRKADIALYRAKRNGRNQYVAFEPEMDYSVLQRTEIEISVLGSRAA